MSTVTAAMVRIFVYAAALAGYYAALPYLFPDDGGGANIGAGLIAFAAMIAISFAWATFDGRARGFGPAAVIWAVVATAVALGWLVALAVSEADPSMSAAELIRHDLGGLPFTIGLVLAPALVGAFIGNALQVTGIEA